MHIHAIGNYPETCVPGFYLTDLLDAGILTEEQANGVDLEHDHGGYLVRVIDLTEAGFLTLNRVISIHIAGAENPIPGLDLLKEIYGTLMDY